MTNTLDLMQFPYLGGEGRSVPSGISVFSEPVSRSSESEWQSAITALGRMINLRDDWDGMGSTAPDLEVIAAATRLVEDYRQQGTRGPDRVLASPLGTVSFEWLHNLGSLVEVEVVNNSTMEWIQYQGGFIVARGREVIRTAQLDSTPAANRSHESLSSVSEEWEIAV